MDVVRNTTDAVNEAVHRRKLVSQFIVYTGPYSLINYRFPVFSSEDDVDPDFRF